MSEKYLQEIEEIVRSHVRDVPDFPAEGVLFRDITPLIAHGEAFSKLIKAIANNYEGKIDAIAGLESRGFILGAPVAAQMGLGMLTIRKAGRLPGPVVGVDYALEYGTARMELQPFTVSEGQRVLVIDDVLATGGTAAAAIQIIEQSGAECAGLCFLLELEALGGRQLIKDYDVQSIVTY